PIHGGVNPRAPIGGKQPLDFGDEIEIFHHRHVGIERRRFRQIPGSPFRFDRLLEHVEAGHDGASFGCRNEASQNPHRRGLAGAIGSQDPEIFAALHCEAHVVHRRDSTVLLREVLNLNHWKTPLYSYLSRIPSLSTLSLAERGEAPHPAPDRRASITSGARAMVPTEHANRIARKWARSLTKC